MLPEPTRTRSGFRTYTRSFGWCGWSTVRNNSASPLEDIEELLHLAERDRPPVTKQDNGQCADHRCPASDRRTGRHARRTPRLVDTCHQSRANRPTRFCAVPIRAPAHHHRPLNSDRYAHRTADLARMSPRRRGPKNRRRGADHARHGRSDRRPRRPIPLTDGPRRRSRRDAPRRPPSHRLRVPTRPAHTAARCRRHTRAHRRRSAGDHVMPTGVAGVRRRPASTVVVIGNTDGCAPLADTVCRSIPSTPGPNPPGPISTTAPNCARRPAPGWQGLAHPGAQ